MAERAEPVSLACLLLRVGGVAHDCNNMLQTILGLAGLALRGPDLDERLRGLLQDISHATQRSVLFNRQLLALARQQTMPPQRLDLLAVIEGLLPLLRRVLGEGIELIWRPAAGPLWVCLLPTQLDQIVVNLAINARDAMGGSGRLTLEAKAICVPCAAPAHAPGRYVRLAVHDTGCGMSAETRARLFEPFYTTKAEGSGLGLSTVADIVRQRAGFIDVSSIPGRGTTFHIHLPQQDGIPETSVPATALLVDAAPIVRTTVQRMLESLGYRVRTAATAAEALQWTAQPGEKVRVLVTDVAPSGMNGVELARRLTKQWPHLGCLFMSGHPGDIVDSQGLPLVNEALLRKPFTREDLARHLRALTDPADVGALQGLPSQPLGGGARSDP